MTLNGQRTGFTVAALGMLAACVLPPSNEPAAGLFAHPMLLAATVTVAILFAGAALLEHVPQKWEPVLRKRTCSNKVIEQDDDSKKRHPALALIRPTSTYP